MHREGKSETKRSFSFTLTTPRVHVRLIPGCSYFARAVGDDLRENTRIVNTPSEAWAWRSL